MQLALFRKRVRLFKHQGWSSELGEVAAKLASELPTSPPARPHVGKRLRVDGKQEINLEWPKAGEHVFVLCQCKLMKLTSP